MLATAFGIAIGPHGANIFNPRSWSTNSNGITLEVMRITLATGLFAIGVELPRAYMARHSRSLFIMVRDNAGISKNRLLPFLTGH